MEEVEVTEEEIKEVDFVVRDDYIPPSVVVTLLLVFILVFTAAICWVSVNIHRADAVTDQWRIWSERCEQIVNVNAEQLRSDKEVTYFGGCPEGPRNEPVTINR